MDRRGKVSLSGASKTEISSQQALQIAKEQRLRRHLERAQPKAATVIQRNWRGGCCRRAVQTQLRREWLQRYDALVTQQAALTAVQLAEYMLPLALLAFLPPPGRRRAALQGSQPLQAASLGDTAALRGSFALLLRSLTARDVKNNLLGLSAMQADRRSALLGQLKRLLTLCCAVVGTRDVLLQAAAARIVALLCDERRWICLGEDAGALYRLAGGLLDWLAPLPMVAQAARRLLVALEARNPTMQHAQQVKAALCNLLNAQLQMALRGDPALDIFVEVLLTAPGMLTHASEPVLAQLAERSVYARLSRCAVLQADCLDGVAAMQAVAALGGVLSGITGGARNGQREQPGTAAEFGAAADALLKRCSDSRGSSPPAAEPVLRQFSDGAFATHLLAALPLPQFCSLYASLLSLCSATHTAPDRGAADANAASMRLLSSLAFGTSLLPQLWSWLALNVGLSLEVHAEATTWEVPSLPHGARSVPARSAQPFGLFCIVYCHYLSVADDVDFHEQQALFALPQQRAITAALNVLVFRTQLPSGAASGSSPGAGEDSTLLQYAPRLLRALYERDSRRRFCPPSLWLQPYRRLAAGGQGDVSGAAVLRALLQMHQADEDEAGSDNRAGPPYGHRQRPPVTHSAAGGLAQLLLQAPQCIPFEERVSVFRGLVALDKEARRYGVAPIEGGPRPARVTVRRSHLLEDVLAQLTPLGGAVRGPLSIEFINAQGMVEAGIDMGGLTKELLESVGAAIFDPDRGLFTATASESLYPHPLATAQPAGQELLHLAGTLLGKALYEGVLLNAPLAPFFVSRLQGRLPSLDDLAALDPDVHRGLAALKRYTGDVCELSLDFTVESDAFGARTSEELIPGGADVAVTNSNRLLYVHLMVDWHLRRRLGPAAAAFAKGLAQVLPAAWLRLFSPGEVNQLLGGGEGCSIDLDDMRRHTQYAGGYSSTSRTVALFWKVVAGLSPADRSAVLRFATSCGRAPLGGFEHLNPPFTIYKVPCGASLLALALLGGPDVTRLPSASTCTNTLKLPNYRRAGTLKEKLLYAVRSGAGFDLS